MRYQVVLTDYPYDDLELEREALGDVDAELIEPDSEEHLAALLPTADAVVTTFYELDESLVERMESCTVISRTGIGVDNVDVDAATNNGIFVTNVPEYCLSEVSDHTMALFLSLTRNVVSYDRQVKGGGWDKRGVADVHRLSEQTYGLVGFGKIARRVAEKAAALGLSIRAYDPYVADDVVAEYGVEPVSDVDAVLADSDVVSVHVPLNEETEGLIGERELAAMKDDAVLINVARGGIVRESALVEALEREEIRAAGLDVFETEPLDPESPLLELDNVVLTPHAAWYSEESVVELRETALRNVRDALSGSVPEYVVNTELAERS